MNKNTLRLLVAVGMIALVLCSWYTLINDAQKLNNEYMTQLNAARFKLEQGLYEDALDYFAAAMEQQDTIELRDEIAQVYQDNASGLAYESYLEDMVEAYPLEIRGYERLAAFYRDTQAFDSCFNIIETVAKRGMKSASIDAIAQELAYAYDLDRCSAVEVTTFSSNFCAVKYKNGVWSYLYTNGGSYTSGTFQQAGPFTSSGLAPVQLKDGSFALIDNTGRHKSLSPKDLEIEECLPLLSGMMSVKYNGKYHYCDYNFQELFGAYDYAGSFYGGYAAVMEGEKWALIDESGKAVTDFIFEEIKMDDKGIAVRNGKAIAKLNGAYVLINTSGKQVGKDQWEDADAFNSDQIAAVCKNGKWGFVDIEGSVVVDYQYDGALSFANGMAAIKVDEQWGYISSEDFQIKIQPAFDDARDFSAGGTAFVKEGTKWRLLRIYRLT